MAVSKASDDGTPPDAVYVHQRWIPQATVEWAKSCDRIMLEHGAVTGSVSYKQRYMARYRARKLMRLLIELRIREPWQLKEHTSRSAGGWIWSVEFNRRSEP